jgi:predicted transcriptional regulator
MEKIPCEHIVWNILPSIRKEFAKSLMNNFNLNQKQIAKMLKLTPAAVSQYLSDKRGVIDITDKDVLNEIDKSARIIFENGSEHLINETCRICNLLRYTKKISTNKEYCINNELSCETTVWNILPAIRKEFAMNLIKNHKLTQRKVANLLGITEAAISRYVSGKRGLLVISDKKILNEILKSTNRIVEGNNKTVFAEICRICTLLKSSKLVININ